MLSLGRHNPQSHLSDLFLGGGGWLTISDNCSMIIENENDPPSPEK